MLRPGLPPQASNHIKIYAGRSSRHLLFERSSRPWLQSRQSLFSVAALQRQRASRSNCHNRTRQWKSNDAGTGDPYELSKHEAAWNKNIERLKQMIEQDPYEAVFGKRFKPFWSPLVTSWIPSAVSRGNQSSTNQRDGINAAVSDATDRDSVSNRKDPVSVPNAKSPAPVTTESVEPIAATVCTNTTTPPLSSASSMPWESESNKPRKVERNPLSKDTNVFQYDPISNRMIQVGQSNKTHDNGSGQNRRTINSDDAQDKSSVPHQKRLTQSCMKRWHEDESLVELRQSTESHQNSTTHSPFSISQNSGSTCLSALLDEKPSIAPVRPKPVALSDGLVPDLDLLTPEDVRASMGKVARIGSQSAAERSKAGQNRDPDHQHKSNHVEMVPPSSVGEDGAAGCSTQNDVRNPTDVSRSQATLLSDGLSNKPVDAHPAQETQRNAQKGNANLNMKRLLEQDGSQRSLELRAREVQASNHLETSLARMLFQNKAPAIADADDSAAHESTEPLAPTTNIPRQWSNQIEIEYAGQLEGQLERYAEKLKSLRQELDTAYRQSALYCQKHVERQKLLEDDVKTLRSKLEWDSETSELDTAYRQSALYSQKHVERQQKLEDDVKTLHSKLENYAKKSELDTACRQSALYSQKHIEGQKKLEGDVKTLHSRLEKYANKSGNSKNDLDATESVRKPSTTQAAQSGSSVEKTSSSDTPKKQHVQAAPVHESVTKGDVQGTRSSYASKSPEAVSSGIRWAYPAVYKVIVHDPGTDIISISTAPSPPGTGEDQRMSVPNALTALYQPAKFLPYFAELQTQGYAIVGAKREVLVFRKARDSNEGKTGNALETRPNISSPGAEDSQSVTNPIRMKDRAVDVGSKVRKTGRMSRRHFTANTPGHSGSAEQHTPARAQSSPGTGDRSIFFYRHYPRRDNSHSLAQPLAPHFNTPTSKSDGEHRSDNRPEIKQEKTTHDANASWGAGGTVKRVLAGATGAAVLMYVIGAVEEKSREQSKKIARPRV